MSGARLTHTCTRKVTRHEDEANKQQQQKGRKGWVALDVVLGLRGWVGGASWDWSGKRKQMHLMTQFLTEMPGRKTGAWKTVIPAKRNSKLGKIPDISLSLSLSGMQVRFLCRIWCGEFRKIPDMSGTKKSFASWKEPTKRSSSGQAGKCDEKKNRVTTRNCETRETSDQRTRALCIGNFERKA